jgi:hypothetical protein
MQWQEDEPLKQEGKQFDLGFNAAWESLLNSYKPVNVNAE